MKGVRELRVDVLGFLRIVCEGSSAPLLLLSMTSAFLECQLFSCMGMWLATHASEAHNIKQCTSSPVVIFTHLNSFVLILPSRRFFRIDQKMEN